MEQSVDVSYIIHLYRVFFICLCCLSLFSFMLLFKGSKACVSANLLSLWPHVLDFLCQVCFRINNCIFLLQLLLYWFLGDTSMPSIQSWTYHQLQHNYSGIVIIRVELNTLSLYIKFPHFVAARVALDCFLKIIAYYEFFLFNLSSNFFIWFWDTDLLSIVHGMIWYFTWIYYVLFVAMTCYIYLMDPL